MPRAGLSSSWTSAPPLLINMVALTVTRIGRGTTLHAGVSIAYATLDCILKDIKCRTLFATHYHELAQMLGHSPPSARTPESGSVKPAARREGVAFWCTDVNEMDGGFSYSYRIKPGVNYNSHAIVSLVTE